MQLNLLVPDGAAYMECLERLYELAKSKGYKMDKRYEEFKNGNRTGMMMAVSAMMADVAIGKLVLK